MDYLREFYDIIGKCGMDRPPYEAWLKRATENAQVWPVMAEGKMVGGVLWKGHTAHVAVLPEWRGRWLRPSHLRAWLSWDHPTDIYAKPTTEEARRLAEKLGFVPIDEEGEPCTHVKRSAACLLH